MANLLWKKNSHAHEGWIPSIFDDFFGNISHSSSLDRFRSLEFVPKINVSETDSAYKVTAELPGMDEEDFEVLIENDVLKIKGEKRSENESKEENFHRFESSYGSFERSIRLPEMINADTAKAKFKNGILTLTIPKDKQGTRAHKLKIESGSDSDSHH